MNKLQKLILCLIGLVIALSCFYLGHKLTNRDIDREVVYLTIKNLKEFEFNTWPSGQWDSIYLTSNANCDDFKGWYALSRRTYDKNDCLKANLDNIPCFIPMLYHSNIHKELCDFNQHDRIYFFREVKDGN